MAKCLCFREPTYPYAKVDEKMIVLFYGWVGYVNSQEGTPQKSNSLILKMAHHFKSEGPPFPRPTRMSRWKLGSKVMISGCYNPKYYPIYK